MLEQVGAQRIDRVEEAAPCEGRIVDAAEVENAIKGIVGIFQRYLEELKYEVAPPKQATIELILGNNREAVYDNLDGAGRGCLESILRGHRIVPAMAQKIVDGCR